MIAKLEASVWSKPAAAFPLRLGAMDVGSNAIRYSLVEFDDVDHYRELEVQRFSVRLGHDAFSSGTLSPGVVEAAVACAVTFRQRLDDLGIVQYRAVATSAVRESRNGGELVDRVRRESGIHLETITGSEEARLVWLAVRRRVDFADGAWILADLGGGSIEISVVAGGGILGSETHPMGTVRLLDDLSAQARNAAEFIHLLERYATRLHLPDGAEGKTEGTVITGGNAEALADLVGAKPNDAGTREISRSELRQVLKRLGKMTVAERVQKLDLREDRADVILPAAIIFDRVVELTGSDRILVPRVGVKDGLLYDLVENVAEHLAHEGELERVAMDAAIAIGRRYRFEEAHALHVRDLALSLFDQLDWLHELGELSRRHLSAAALLHDIGQFISYRRHHKHSWYLVTHSEIPGLTQEDIDVVALVTRYHRRSEPRDYHEGYSEQSSSAKLEIQKLAAILRIADALDHEHQKHVRRLTATRSGGKVVLALDIAGDTALERWALEKKSSLFERVFSTKLQVD